MAYFCGLALGKRITTRPFLSISPNKTWEGFFGGGVCTIIFAYFFPLLLVRFFHPTICPCEVLAITRNSPSGNLSGPNP